MPIQRGRLLAILGVGFGLAVTVGNSVGTGILRTPAEIAKQIDSIPVYFAIWAAGALYALLGANIVAELATRVPRSGGLYVYARAAFGDYAGFVVGWVDWIGTAGSVASVAIVMAESLRALFPAIPFGNGWIGSSMIVLVGLVQWRGVRGSSRLQAVATIAKALVLMLLVMSCLAAAKVAVPEVPRQLPLTIAAVVLALQGVIYTYDGWTGAIYFSEELKDRRDVVKSIFGGLLIVIALYIIVNAGFLFVAPLGTIAQGDLAASTVATIAFGAKADTIVRVTIFTILIGSLTALMLMASRVVFGLARDRLFSVRATEVNAGGTPTVGYLLSAGIAIAFASTGAFNQVIAILSICFVLNYVLTFAALLVLRKRGDGEPAYLAWGHPFTTILAIAGSLAFVVGTLVTDTRNAVTALLLLVVSYPVFAMLKRGALAPEPLPDDVT
jgi:basic amino acid/polyamine antiporter, APA family